MEGQSTNGDFVCTECGIKIGRSKVQLARHLRKCRPPVTLPSLLCHICGSQIRGGQWNLKRHLKRHSVPPTRNISPPAPQSGVEEEEDPLEGPSLSHTTPGPSQGRDVPSPDLFDDTMQDTPLHPELLNIPESFWVPWSQLPPSPPPAGTSTDEEAAINWEQDQEIERGSWLLPEDAHEDLKEIYDKHFPAFRTNIRTGKIQTSYTFRHLPTGVNWQAVLRDIFRLQNCSFKINCSHSHVLENRVTGDLRFYHASSNNASVFERPHLIRNSEDMKEFSQDFIDSDFSAYSVKNRATTQWKVHSVLATVFYVDKLYDHPIGCVDDLSIPCHVKNNKYIKSLHTCSKSGRPFKDNLCFFRALMCSENAARTFEAKTIAAYMKWCEAEHLQPNIDQFPGMMRKDLVKAEKLFQINIAVYEYRDSAAESPLLLKVRSENHFTRVLNLLQVDRHFCLITDVNKCARSFQCETCGRLFRLSSKCGRHEQICRARTTRYRYPGNYYEPHPSQADKLKKNGIPLADTVFPFRACYDFEVLFSDCHAPVNVGQSTTLLNTHTPASVSVCSNIPQYKKARCFVTDGDTQKLVNQFVDYLEELSAASYLILRERNAAAYLAIEAKKREQRDDYVYTAATANDDGNDDGNDADGDADDEDPYNDLSPDALLEILDSYLMELPIVSFNGGKYDLNVIKPWLFRSLLRDDRDNGRSENEMCSQTGNGEVEDTGGTRDKEGRGGGGDDDDDYITFMAKRGNQYLCIATPTLKFLDIVNYLAPGISYDKYLQAFEVEQRKFYFPYEWFTSLEKLKATELPPREEYKSLLRGGQTISEEEYRTCQKAWVENKMKTMLDYLIYYNNLDVVPFLKAIKKQSSFYSHRGLDMFKDGVSVSGLTLRYLFSTLPRDIRFSLCSEKNSDLLDLLKSEIVGGPSIVFHRYHESEKTRIRAMELGERAKVCQKIIGYDANALYLSSLMLPQPCRHPIRRRKENNFRPEYQDLYGDLALQWLGYIEETEGVKLEHKFNGGERALGKRKIHVDGFCVDTKTAYNFHGCFWHGCPNPACPKINGETFNPKTEKSFQELRGATEEIAKYIREGLGIKLNEIQQCEWEALCRTDEIAKECAKKRNFSYSWLPTSSENTITLKEIQKAVLSGNLFGLVQCDIEVPRHKEEYFQDCPPIFKNAHVSIDDIGDHMKEYAQEHNLLSTPRRLLIGSMRGKNILLTTPLLKFYLNKGLVMTDVQQVVHYKPERCFVDFGNWVTDSRRAADMDPKKKILADVSKLIGNSAYGKTATRVEKHCDILLVKSQDKVQKLLASPLYQKMTELGEDLYEVEMLKSSVSFNLPVQIAFFVYAYAKLRLLEFIYDCVDKFVARPDYQLIESDTDSLYLALSGDSLDDVIKPDMRREFFTQYKDWFISPACDRHYDDFVESRVHNRPWSGDEECCQKNKIHGLRTPGLFKVEWKGKGAIALCSKTYICYGEESTKLSTKGLNKRQNNIDKEEFMNVLNTKQSGSGVNVGFKTDGTKVMTYRQSRQGLSYLYLKRRVMDDGISTKFLDI